MSKNEQHAQSLDLLRPPTAQTTDDYVANRPRLSRSPHPYHRRGSSLLAASDGENNHVGGPFEKPRWPPAEGKWDEAVARKQTDTAYPAAPSRTPSESGTEGDEEGFKYVKALPPAPQKPRKGLADGTDFQAGAFTPLLTPQVDQEAIRSASSYFETREKAVDGKPEFKDTSKTRITFRQRRLAEYLRRSSETISLGFIACVVLYNPSAFNAAQIWLQELLAYVLIIAILYLLYPTRIFLAPLWSEYVFKFRRVHIPAAFDPAPLLYPEALPILVALSLSQSQPTSINLNLVLGISALPAPIVPRFGSHQGANSVHWFITCIPLLASRINLYRVLPWISTYAPPERIPILSEELLCLAFPLHQALVKTLHYLTTTSLLYAEVQLLSIALINLLFLSKSPQALILTSVIWIGGLGLFVFCGRVLAWNVALERIPSQKFKRAREVIRAATRFAERGRHFSVDISDAHVSTADWEKIRSGSPNRRNVLGSDHTGCIDASNSKSILNGALDKDITTLEPLKRWQTAPAVSISPDITTASMARTHRRMSFTSTHHSYLAMTNVQIETRKWLYSLYTFAAVISIILVPIRYTVSVFALSSQEPFSWAATYLFGHLPGFETFVKTNNLQQYVFQPPSLSDSTKASRCSKGWADADRIWFIGEANTRLLLFVYWAATIAVGMACVFRLSEVAEVDTRRKIFHGTMVVMLLPTAYIDPGFLSLGLALVLAVFLLLDLFRAAQLRPLSKPLARFLTPYVDGRDLRGPVVVSHIFLLIGCSIPFWLSLGGIERSGSGAWTGWDVKTRDVSMVAGVVCVGMGDAAASLVGRRIGRRKWPWAGGKSLEGSTAFAVAVTLGLLLGKAWLRLGRWPTMYGDDDESWVTIFGKAGVAAASASFTEAVLTGCNDNVVVPVILWLLVRGLQL